ncbi:hypothetical protein CDD83_8973 [Cordyceps sp. RAO-2017]|nr:hypothetical protein CDD83_8973 [Cordyceps sp. RAO-2017]
MDEPPDRMLTNARLAEGEVLAQYLQPAREEPRHTASAGRHVASGGRADAGLGRPSRRRDNRRYVPPRFPRRTARPQAGGALPRKGAGSCQWRAWIHATPLRPSERASRACDSAALLSPWGTTGHFVSGHGSQFTAKRKKKRGGSREGKRDQPTATSSKPRSQRRNCAEPRQSVEVAPEQGEEAHKNPPKVRCTKSHTTSSRSRHLSRPNRETRTEEDLSNVPHEERETGENVTGHKESRRSRIFLTLSSLARRGISRKTGPETASQKPGMQRGVIGARVLADGPPCRPFIPAPAHVERRPSQQGTKRAARKRQRTGERGGENTAGSRTFQITLAFV